MKWTITASDAFPLVEVELQKGDSLKAESGAMVAMSDGLSLTGSMDGGFLKSMARKFSGESFFLQKIEAPEKGGTVLLAPPAPGAIVELPITATEQWSVQKNGFLAGTAGVEISTRTQSLARGLFSGGGFFIVSLSGAGTAFLSTYGSARAIDLKAGESMLVDNGHLLAWRSDMRYEITKAASSWFNALLAGSGFGCRFFGPGRIWLQTRSPYALGAWLFPYIPLPPPRQVQK
jgi:uncharacterized protein (TIGR00266 family)